MKNKLKFITFLSCLIICFFTLIVSFYVPVMANSNDVDLSNTDKCVKTNLSSTISNQQYMDSINSLTNSVYRNGSYFSFEQTLTLTNLKYDSNLNLYHLYFGAFYYDTSILGSFDNAKTLYSDVHSAYPIGYYPIFDFGGYRFYAKVIIRNEGVGSNQSQYNNGEFFNIFALFFDSSTLTYNNLDSSNNELLSFNVTNDTITIKVRYKVNDLIASGVSFDLVTLPNSYVTGSNASSYVDINDFTIYNIWNNNLQNVANNKFYDNILRVTTTKLELPFNITINYSVANKYLFNTLYVGLNTGIDTNVYVGNFSSIISSIKLNFANDIYNFYDYPNTRSLLQYSFTGDITSYLVSIDKDMLSNVWTGLFIKDNSTRFKVVNYSDGALYFYFDGKLNTGINSLYVNNDNALSIDLYRNNVQWYDIFGHLYNFMIYLIFDMPLISNVIKPVYFGIETFITSMTYFNGYFVSLGIFGAFAMVYLLYAIVKRFL